MVRKLKCRNEHKVHTFSTWYLEILPKKEMNTHFIYSFWQPLYLSILRRLITLLPSVEGVCRLTCGFPLGGTRLSACSSPSSTVPTVTIHPSFLPRGKRGQYTLLGLPPRRFSSKRRVYSLDRGIKVIRL